MEFGSAIHYALEQLFLKMKADAEKQFPSKENFIENFEWWMKRHRESFTEEQFNRRCTMEAKCFPITMISMLIPAIKL